MTTPPPETGIQSDLLCNFEVQGFANECAEPFYKEHAGRRYCVLHFPGQEKTTDFEKALRRKVEAQDFDFYGVWFPEADFSNTTFSAGVYFGHATFSTGVDFIGATFSAGAYFGHATFNTEADFTGATFSAGADFNGATFNARADFSDVKFSARADFSDVKFSARADFSDATFSGGASFGSATFSTGADFVGAAFSTGADFVGAAFSDRADFSDTTFGAVAAFIAATFTAAAFRRASFGEGVEFGGVKFSAVASFYGATFSGGANFGAVTFSDNTNFSKAAFGDNADFSDTRFDAVAYFSEAIFGDYVRFSGIAGGGFGDSSSLDLAYARVGKPDHVSFHTVTLTPCWFVNVDARKFDFTNVTWTKQSISKEVGKLKAIGVASPHRLLSIACRQLAVNAEENHRYEEASRFRFMSMDARRQEQWGGFPFWRLSWWYWVASGYGERVWQAAAVLVILILLFALAYNKLGFEQKQPAIAHDEIGMPLSKRDAIIYSLQVITFQKPEPRPLTWFARTLVTLELILGPVQAALFVLAVRRKFIR